jgi:hypothetical protein
MQTWCARYQWPGRKPFIFGTVALARAPQHEVEAALRAEFTRRMMSILPDGMPLPDLLQLLPGALILVGPEDA